MLGAGLSVTRFTVQREVAAYHGPDLGDDALFQLRIDADAIGAEADSVEARQRLRATRLDHLDAPKLLDSK